MRDDIKKAVDKIPVKELRSFVSKLAHDNETVMGSLMSTFPKLFATTADPGTYYVQVKDLFSSHEDSKWGMSWSGQSDLYYELCDLIDSLRKEKGKEKSGFLSNSAAIQTAFSILRQVVETIEHADDSQGTLGSIASLATDTLYEVAEADLDEDDRQMFMEECTYDIEDKTYQGWGWEEDMFALLVQLVKGDEECSQADKMMVKAMKADASQWLAERIYVLRRDLIAKWKGDGAAHEFMLRNLYVEQFRVRAIEEAIAAKDFKQAYKLGEEGIAQNQKDKPGLVPRWNKLLLKTAQAENDKERIVEYARRLFLYSFNVEGDFYAILKSNVPSEQWPDFVEQLAKDAQNVRYSSLYPDLCVSEGWQERLHQYVLDSNSFLTMRKYEKYLLPQYKDFVVKNYIGYSLHLMKNSFGRNRNTYKDICGYLEHVKSLGEVGKVKDAATQLRQNYKRCRALLEELSNVGL